MGDRTGSKAFQLVPLVGPIAQMFQLGDEHWQVPILAVIETIEVQAQHEIEEALGREETAHEEKRS